MRKGLRQSPIAIIRKDIIMADNGKKSQYQIIRELVAEIRKGSKTYQQMLDTLTQADIDEAAARKILDRLLLKQVDEEEDGEDE